LSAQPTEPPGEPSGWENTTADLLAEAAFLSRELGHARVRTPGTAGILNDSAPSTVWVHDEVDVDALLREVDGWHPCPGVMVPEHADSVADALDARGWDTGSLVERFWRRLETPSFSRSSQTDVLVRAATRADLPALRRLHVLSFGADDSADYLPDAIFDVPALCLFLAVSPTSAGEVLGAAGVRLRHRGALVFGLATAPQHQRRGIGAGLVAECMDWAAAHGAPFAVADVDAPASSLWAQLGFQMYDRWRRCSPPAR
jgi:GNAT superfamily N-acetyltransferase